MTCLSRIALGFFGLPPGLPLHPFGYLARASQFHSTRGRRQLGIDLRLRYRARAWPQAQPRDPYSGSRPILLSD
jgi:hypothetical protein